MKLGKPFSPRKNKELIQKCGVTGEWDDLQKLAIARRNELGAVNKKV